MRKRFATLDDQRAGEFLGVYRSMAEIMEVVPEDGQPRAESQRRAIPQPGRGVGRTYLVTRDKDMLDLMAHPDFTARYPGLKILGPVELLRELAPPIKLEEERGRDVGREP